MKRPGKEGGSKAPYKEGKNIIIPNGPHKDKVGKVVNMSYGTFSSGKGWQVLVELPADNTNPKRTISVVILDKNR